MAFYDPGRYRCRVVGQGFGNSRQKGTPYFYLRIVPEARIVSDEDEDCVTTQYERDVMLYLTDKTVDRVVEQLAQMGWEGASFDELDPLTGDYVSFDGMEITCSCDHEENDAKVYEKWDLAFGGAGGLEHERQNDCVRQLNAMFGKALRGKRQASVSREAPEQPAKPHTIPEKEADDIPF